MSSLKLVDVNAIEVSVRVPEEAEMSECERSPGRENVRLLKEISLPESTK